MSEVERLKRLRRMQWLAHLLLLAMFGLYLVTGFYEHSYPWLGYVRAFAEAGTVGALADWFAVTALFREPMGLPIPHTAIIKRRKDEIGETLADFVGTHFLNRDALTPRLARIDAVGVAADWLARGDNAEGLIEDVSQVLQRMMRTGDNEALRAIVKENLLGSLNEIEVTPLLGQVLEMLILNDPDDTLLTGLVVLAQQQFDDNRESLRDTVGDKTPWWLPGFVDERIYRKLVDEVETALSDDTDQGEQRAREHLRRVLADVVAALQYDNDLIERGERLKDDVLSHERLGQHLSRVAQDISQFLTRQVQDKDSAFRERLVSSMRNLGEGLAAAPGLQDEINASLRDAALYVITRYRDQITQVISDTVQGWDADQAANLIETRVGRDLQFIRINGTLVGGLAGLTLYTLWHALT
ncbi:MAG: DUF445 domain-containing protein [Pseudomonadota bacterium]